MFNLMLLFVSLSFAEPVKVAVIDTGFDENSTWSDASVFGLKKPKLCKDGHESFAKTPTPYGIQDFNGHGTHVAGLIAKHAEDADYCLVILKYFDDRFVSFVNDKNQMVVNNFIENSNAALRKAIDSGVSVINYSGGGYLKNVKECEMVKEALDKGIVFVAAAGNDGKKLSNNKFYPAMCDSRVVVVVNTDENGKLVKSSNYVEKNQNIFTASENGYRVLSLLPNNKVGLLTGTSQSAAVRSGKIVKSIHDKRKQDERHVKKVSERKSKNP